jgi:putative ABC transport system permease protein
MKLGDLVELAFGAMRDRKVRAVLTILGIVIGPAAIVGLLSVTNGFNESVTGQLSKLGSTTVAVIPASGSKVTPTTIETIQQIPGVKAVYPYYLIPAVVKGTSESISIIAVDLDQGLRDAVPGLELQSGNWPEPTDYSSGAVGWTIANPTDTSLPTFNVDQVITLTINNRFTNFRSVDKSFIVNAVAKEFGPSFFLNPDSSVLIPLDSGRILTKGASYTGLLVIADGISSVDSMQSAMQDSLGKDFNVFSVKSILRVVNTILGNVTFILLAVASISVLVAFIGIMTTMFTAVIERTREIGLLKALGFNNRSVLLMFVAESTLIGVVGGLIGAATGVGLGYIMSAVFSVVSTQNVQSAGALSTAGSSSAATAFSGISPVFTPELIVGAIVMAAAVGAVAGLLPAWRAAKLTPVEALRYE